jgi:Carboxypeptidase regulatory-like domain
VLQINAAPGEDLGPWLEAARDQKRQSLPLEQRYLSRYTIAPSPTAPTDAEGRFRLTGIGRNRLVRAQLDGPTIASQRLYILTRPGTPVEVTEHLGNPEYGEPRTVTTYYGADFRHAAAPCQPIVGVVRDKDTRKPLPGITVRGYAVAVGTGGFRALNVVVRATTDADGRYRLTGMPKGKGYSVVAMPGRDLPYVTRQMEVPDGLGLDPVTVDIELKRGVWIEGRLTDKVTGKPIQGSVEYFALSDNPNLRDYPGFDGTALFNAIPANENGSYRVVGLPGPGVVGVYYQRDPYLRATERDDEFGTTERSLSTAPYHISFTSSYSALARIDPAPGAGSVKRDVTLDPGWLLTGTVLGPDGRPLAGARGFGLTGRWWEAKALKTAEFKAHFNPRRPGELLFQHSEKGLVGSALPPKENGGTVTVRMEPGAAVNGRLVGADGKPRVGVEVDLHVRHKDGSGWQSYSVEGIRTDRDGRFRFAALLPGYEYRVLSDGWGYSPFGAALRTGRTEDLGDLRDRRAQE